MSKLKVSGNKLKPGQYYINDNPRDIHGNVLPKVPAMVSACVSFHRKKMLPIRTIYLCPVYYVQFTDWFRKLALEHEADLGQNCLTWDGVNIDMMEKHHIQRASNGNDLFDYDFYKITSKGNV